MPEDCLSIRPHHLLCMLTYIGKGYSDVFVESYDQVINQLKSGQHDIVIVRGPDAICAPRLCDPSDTECHCRESHINDRDDEALADLNKMPEFAMLDIGSTLKLTKNLINRLRDVYKKGSIRTACNGCEWKDLCDGISHDNFKGTKLK